MSQKFNGFAALAAANGIAAQPDALRNGATAAEIKAHNRAINERQAEEAKARKIANIEAANAAREAAEQRREDRLYNQKGVKTEAEAKEILTKGGNIICIWDEDMKLVLEGGEFKVAEFVWSPEGSKVITNDVDFHAYRWIKD